MRKCKLCFKNISVKGFGQHLKRNHSGRTEKCKLCYFKFKRKDSLKHHIETVHKSEQHLLSSDIVPNDCTHSCQLCSYKFISNVSLEFHIKQKHGRGNEKCENCQKRFPDSKRLTMHTSKFHSETLNK